MKLRISLVNSTIGRPRIQRKVVESLGLKKLGSVVEHEDVPSIRGMITKISHLLKVEEIK